eukprot:TRINITY_DN650_c0_g1_i10.p1 TRINITY_DN650_c0_g1~~TRINITY_DN650_c0_g1_i10.p1  ORF type:complete len:310 (+),score=45.80 TRINITY_DN650_c0_g1_i10:1477-2406(+)
MEQHGATMLESKPINDKLLPPAGAAVAHPKDSPPTRNSHPIAFMGKAAEATALEQVPFAKTPHEHNTSYYSAQTAARFVRPSPVYPPSKTRKVAVVPEYSVKRESYLPQQQGQFFYGTALPPHAMALQTSSSSPNHVQQQQQQQQQQLSVADHHQASSSQQQHPLLFSSRNSCSDEDNTVQCQEDQHYHYQPVLPPPPTAQKQVIEPDVPFMGAHEATSLDYIGLYEEVFDLSDDIPPGAVRVWRNAEDHYYYDCSCGKRKAIRNLKAILHHVIRHTSLQNKGLRYPCDKCERVFTHYLGLNSHQRTHK